MANLQSGTRIYGTANVDTQINLSTNLTINTISFSYIGNTTTSPTIAIANTGSLTIGNSSTTQTASIITLANSAGNVQITPGTVSINATGSINAASHTVGTTFIANSTQLTITTPFSANASVGTAGQVLVSNGATGSPFWSSAVRSGTSVATTSGTSVDYLSIPSYVKRITVMYNGFSTSSTSNYLIQLITGASTVVSTGYVSSCRSATSTAGFLTVDGPTAASLTSGSITISNLSGNIWVSSGNLQISGGVVYYSAGIISLAAALTGVRITSVTPDTLDAGSVNILYE